MLKDNGGLIGGTRTASALGSGVGLWTPNEQAALRRNRSWPLSGDPFYSYNSLLLSMDGANNSTTFTDSSPYGLTVTANGDAKISTAQSKFGGASAAFDGTGDYLQVSSALSTIGAGNFTVEAWVRVTTPSSAFIIFDCRNADFDVNGFTFYVRSTEKLAFGTGNPFAVSESSTSIISNIWAHVALTRSGSTVRGFLNGVQEFSLTNSSDFTRTQWRFGQQHDASYTSSGGYIDDLRITKGVARYTSNFTPPTQAHLTYGGYNDPYFPATSLLLHMDGSNGSTTFTDSSVNALTVTANGNAQISTAQSKFGGTSAYFDGTGDGLSLASNAAFGFGTGDFTIEMWLYQSVSPTSGSSTLIDNRSAFGASPFSFYLKYTASGTFLGLYTSVGVTSCEWDAASQRLAINTWNHIVLVRRSGSFSAFINGTKCTTVSFGNETAISGDFGAAKPLRIGIAADGSASPLNGYIDDLRITKGVARYTANFTPPTAPFPDL